MRIGRGLIKAAAEGVPAEGLVSECIGQGATAGECFGLAFAEASIGLQEPELIGMFQGEVEIVSREKHSEFFLAGEAA